MGKNDPIEKIMKNRKAIKKNIKIIKIIKIGLKNKIKYGIEFTMFFRFFWKYEIRKKLNKIEKRGICNFEGQIPLEVS